MAASPARTKTWDKPQGVAVFALTRWDCRNLLSATGLSALWQDWLSKGSAGADLSHHLPLENL